jgi:hypothetical protein
MLVVGAGGCSSRSVVGDAGDGPAQSPDDDGGTPQFDCGLVTQVPAILELVDSATGQPICPSTVQVTGVPRPIGGEVTTSETLTAINCATASPPLGGCPSRPDGGGAWCPFAVLGLRPHVTYEVQVSVSGFRPASADSVKAGEGGCVPDVPATHSRVELVSDTVAAPR